jgi:cell division transport system permease protein
VSARLGTSLVVWILIGIALALPGGLYVLERNLNALAADWQGRPGLSIYFDRDASASLARDLGATLEADAAVEAVKLVSAEEALAEFQQVADVADALSLLGENPLPMSLRVTPKAGAEPAALERLAERAGKAKGVHEVAIEKTWLERLQAMTTVVWRLGWILAALFALGAVLVTATSVRLAIEARLEELRVMILVGATRPYIRRPFLYFGLIYGLGGGVVGAMLIASVLRVVEAPVAALIGSYGSSFELGGFTPGFLAGLLIAGGVLGVAGALVAARQRLRDLTVV